jgi:hypothetical protein
MKTTTQTLLSSTLLALTVTCGAFAIIAPPTTPPAPGGPTPGVPGGGGPGGGGGRQRPKFEDLDKNNDGFITEDEVSKEMWERMKKRDADGDGKISKEEFGKGRPGGPGGPGGPGPGGPGGPGGPTAPPAPKA